MMLAGPCDCAAGCCAALATPIHDKIATMGVQVICVFVSGLTYIQMPCSCSS